MRNFDKKTTNQDTLSATEFNGLAEELENTCLATGESLFTGGQADVDPNTNQLQASIIKYVSSSTYLQDSGRADLIVLTSPNGYKFESSLINNQVFSFKAIANNTGATQISVYGGSTVPLLSINGTPLTAGDILAQGLYEVVSFFTNGILTSFQLLAKKSLVTASGINQYSSSTIYGLDQLCLVDDITYTSIISNNVGNYPPANPQTWEINTLNNVWRSSLSSHYVPGTIFNVNGTNKYLKSGGDGTVDPALDDGTNYENFADSTGGAVGDNSVSTIKIVDKAVTSAKLADEAVTTSKIADGSITEDKLNFSIQDGSVNDDAVSTVKIQDEAVTEPKIGYQAVTVNKLGVESVTAEKLATNSVSADKLTVDTVTTTKIANSAVTGDKIAVGAITASKIASDTITSSEIAAGAITSSELADNSVTSTKIASKVVDHSHIDGVIHSGETTTKSKSISVHEDFVNRSQYIESIHYTFKSSELVSISVSTYKNITVHPEQTISIPSGGTSTSKEISLKPGETSHWDASRQGEEQFITTTITYTEKA